MSEIKHALEEITKRLAPEQPVILHDAHDSGHYILLLKGLSSLTLDRDLTAPTSQDPLMKYLKSIEKTLPFLAKKNLISGDWDMHTLHIDGRQITGFVVPGGKQGVDALAELYRDNGVASPFALLTTGADKGMIDVIAGAQGLDGARGRQ